MLCSQRHTLLVGSSDRMSLLNCRMFQLFCPIPTTATNVANAESANGKPRLLQCNKLDCATAVRSKPWKAL